MIGIIDYGGGNVMAFVNVLNRLNYDSCIVTGPDQMDEIQGLIFPGVGSWDSTIAKLKERLLWNAIIDFAKQGRPLLGVCLGMQVLFDDSEEGEARGLGLVPGRVKLLKAKIVPHMGWNLLNIDSDSNRFQEFEGQEFYHIHSYYCDCNSADSIVGSAEYDDLRFTTLVNYGNIVGCQFHPEKSHGAGEKFIEKFIKLCYEEG